MSKPIRVLTTLERFEILGHRPPSPGGNPTGAREAFGYEIAKRNNMRGEPTEDDSTGGWAHDPFGHSATGFVMNVSDLPDFDLQFPNHPLTMARELLRTVGAS